MDTRAWPIISGNEWREPVHMVIGTTDDALAWIREHGHCYSVPLKLGTPVDYTIAEEAR